MNLKLTLELHLKWLKGEKDGRRADLRRADLWSTIGNKSQVKSGVKDIQSTSGNLSTILKFPIWNHER